MKKIIRLFLAVVMAALCFSLMGCETGTGTDFDHVRPTSSVSESLEKVIEGEE